MRAGSVGCSHLNQWLAACHDEVETPFPEKLADKGKATTSKAVVVAKNKDCDNAVQIGLDWTVIKWGVAQ